MTSNNAPSSVHNRAARISIFQKLFMEELVDSTLSRSQGRSLLSQMLFGSRLYLQASVWVSFLILKILVTN